MDAQSVYNLLVRLGRTATVRTYPLKTFDATTQITTLGTPTDYTLKVIPPYRNREGRNETEMITSGVGLTGIANKDLLFTVQAGIQIIVNGKTWTVTGFVPVSDKSGVLLYLLEIESGN